jgi:hypothetical protein
VQRGALCSPLYIRRDLKPPTEKLTPRTALALEEHLRTLRALETCASHEAVDAEGIGWVGEGWDNYFKQIER